jgi:hypothetical protein
VRGNPHAAFDEAGAGNVARSRWCDTAQTKGRGNGEYKLRPKPVLVCFNISDLPARNLNTRRALHSVADRLKCKDTVRGFPKVLLLPGPLSSDGLWAICASVRDDKFVVVF